YADYTDKWFRRVQEVHFVPQRDFYVVVSFTPPDVQNLMVPWHGRRSIHKHEEFVETLSRLTKTVLEQLRGSNLRPAVLTKKEVPNLIYQHLNPSLAETDFDAPRRRGDQSEASSLARSALKIHDQYLWLDGKYVGTQYMAETPHETWMGWLVDLLTLSVEYS